MALFGLSKTEINGMLILLPFTFILLIAPSIYRNYFGITYDTYETDKRLLDSLVNAINLAIVPPEPAKETLELDYFLFNPNTVSVNELSRLGISNRLAYRIRNYRDAGGSFKVKSDLRKIYGFADSTYFALEVFIDLPIERVSSPKQIKYPKEKELEADESIPAALETNVEKEPFVQIDIATADTTQLKTIKGIGSSYAKRIVGYRKLLGGYSELAQLKEVYGFSDSLFQILKPNFTISDSVSLATIPINLASFKELNRHPYISFEQTKEILNTKSKSGKFRKMEDLFRLKTFDSAQVLKLAPYLNFR